MRSRIKSSFKIIYAGLSDVGIQRDENQDSFGQFPENSLDQTKSGGLLFIVADGMGGHINGQEASRMAVRIVSREYYNKKLDMETGRAMASAIHAANKTIYQRAAEEADAHQMGTTASVLVLENDAATIAHVGDSRIYLIRDEKIIQLTTDHTKVEELQRAGLINEEEAENHPEKSVLHRALGVKEQVKVDISENIKLKAGDVFILCTDGLALISNVELRSIATNFSPQQACQNFIDLANKRGGHDNSTVQVIKLEGSTEKVKHVGGKIIEFSGMRILGISLISLFFIFLFLTIYIIKSYQTVKVKIPDTDLRNEKTQSYKIEQLLQRAQRHTAQNLYDNAILDYQQILKINPLNLDALSGLDHIADHYIRKGIQLQRMGDRHQALNNFKLARQIKAHDQILLTRIKNLEIN